MTLGYRFDLYPQKMTISMMSYSQEPLHSTLNLPTAPEDPMPDTVPSRVGQQQLIPHEYTEAPNVGGDLENTSPGPMVQPVGAFGEMSDNEWTGRLYSNWNGTYAYARALAAEAIGNPYAHAFL
jgi:hypothetical protein